jgi:hypothetical protein
MSVARATVRQKKTGRPVRFELTEQTRQAVDAYLKVVGKKPGEFLFTSRRRPGEGMTTRQYARFVSDWIAGIGLDPCVRNALTPAHEGDADLSPHWQSARGTAIARPYQDREHGEIPRYRGRRRTCHRGRGRHLKLFGQSDATLPESSNGAILAEDV